ncbi:N-acetylneuraminate synthase family protein [bacterium]|nr:N-acetylneuraminate synthase family protein [bacterium]
MYNTKIYINKREISLDAPVYFIADLASNHNGSLEKAKELICLAKESGADAVKFQHFKAEKIVSDYGFKNLGKKVGHQSSWNKSVFEIYKQYELNREWITELYNTAKSAGIDFLSTPYDIEAFERLKPYVCALKIGSGDITWISFIKEISKIEKPVLLAAGASSLEDVKRAVDAVLENNRNIVLLQCNTNYTGSLDNFKFVNLRALETFKNLYPGMVLGLSDHTPGCSAVLGAVALGARVIEKHFTDNNQNIGPDHLFSMNPTTWYDMVCRTRELELCLGDGIKRVEHNEKESIIVQRRCLRFVKDVKKGHVLQETDLESLRPLADDWVEPYEIDKIIGKKLVVSKKRGEQILYKDVE